MLRVLHISDPHYGALHYYSGKKTKRDGVPTMHEAVVSSLTAHGKMPVHALVISGDFFSKDQRNDCLSEATPLVKEMLAVLKLKPPQVLVVPGNHDVAWNADEGTEYHEFNSLCEATGLACDAGKFPIVRPLPARGAKLLLIGLNSTIVETKDRAGIGLVGQRQLDRLSVMLQKHDGKLPRIAVLHHHLIAVNDQSRELTGTDGKLPTITLDASTLLDELLKANVFAVLHGHRHDPLLHAYRPLWRPGSALAVSGQEVAVIASGTTGGIEAHLRQFFVYEIVDGEMTAFSFQTRENDGQFHLHDKRTLKVSPGPSYSGSYVHPELLILNGLERFCAKRVTVEALVNRIVKDLRLPGRFAGSTEIAEAFRNALWRVIRERLSSEDFIAVMSSYVTPRVAQGFIFWASNNLRDI